MSATEPTLQSWNGPTSTIPALQEYGPLPGDDPDRDDAGEHGIEELDYPDPITHGQGVNVVTNEVASDAHVDDAPDTIYRRLYAAWREHVADREYEPYVVVEDAHELFDFANDDYPAHLTFKSKGWMAGTASDGEQLTAGRRYEYSLQLTRYDPDSGELKPDQPLPVNYQCWVRPQERGLVYPDGEALPLLFGAGTKFHAQSTYAEPLEAVNRTLHVVTAALLALDAGRPDWSTINPESLKIWKAEVHHRFDRELMASACETLDEAKRLINYGGGADMEQHSKRAEAGRVRELVRADRWDCLGFVQPDGLDLAVKVYRSSNWHAYRDETYKHPKIEAFLAGTHNDQELPHVREWYALRGVLRQLVTGVAVRSGITMADLVQDDYYGAWERENVDVPIPTGWQRRLREANEDRERAIYRTTMSSLSRARWDVLYTVAKYEGATYEQLQEVTGLSYDYVRDLVRELEDADVLSRLTWPRIIVYHNEELRVNALDLLRDVHPDETITSIKDRGEERRERREQQRRDRAERDTTEETPDDTGGTGGAAGAADSDAGRDATDEPRDDPDAASDASSAATGPPGDAFLPAGEWRTFDALDVLTADELRHALRRDYIEEIDVAIRLDEYDWLG